MSSGTKNSVGDFLRSVFSTLVNKDDSIFKALFSNPEETGAIETIFNSLEATRAEWCNNSNVYNQNGEILEKSLSYFSILQRLYEEDDESYKDRNALLYYRNGDTIWGDKWDILSIFKSYFGTKQIYIVNDTNSKDENLFFDGDFEEKNAWELIGCQYSSVANFSEGIGILFDIAGAVCRQSRDVDPYSTYFVHFFLKGNISVQIQDNRGLYWDAAKGEFGKWISHPARSNFSVSEDWDARRLFILTDGATNKITVSFISPDENTTYLDYTRLFKKGNWSSFTLIANFSGIYTKDTMAMAPGIEDPVKKRDYSFYGHFSDGKQDADTTDPDDLSFIEQTPIAETFIAKEKNNTNNMYLDEQTPVAGDGSVEIPDTLSFIEQTPIDMHMDNNAPIIEAGVVEGDTGNGYFSDRANDNKPVDDPMNVTNIDDPLMAGGKNDDDNTDIKATNNMYIESESIPLAPNKGDDDDGVDVDYELMSYVEQANIFGNDVIRPESVYTELLDIVRAGGITPYIEILTKNAED
ncbi:hypothetical protein FACS1894137_05710 [Spirochaetia bacterium]|nr:hypothetical protein FACS1894137_05710 [Spirochaetia bacterium]